MGEDVLFVKSSMLLGEPVVIKFGAPCVVILGGLFPDPMPGDGVLKEVVEVIPEISREPGVVQSPEGDELGHEHSLDEFLEIKVIKREVVQIRAFEEQSDQPSEQADTEDDKSGQSQSLEMLLHAPVHSFTPTKRSHRGQIILIKIETKHLVSQGILIIKVLILVFQGESDSFVLWIEFIVKIKEVLHVLIVYTVVCGVGVVLSVLSSFHFNIKIIP